jgi:L-malate glycosyltransferase
MKIYAFHLLNDYSGSPKVLMQLVNGWIEKEIEVTIVTCKGRKGFLSDLRGARYVTYWYRWAANPFVRLINLSLSQFFLFLKLLAVVKKDDIIYVNTVLPFGAAVLGKVLGCRIIYHIHETSMKPALLKRFLFGIVSWTATDVVYVSNFLAKQEPLKSKRVHILPNAIEEKFLKEAKAYTRPERKPQNILMVCSLKTYKGVNEFIALAEIHPALQFKLIVNASKDDINSYVQGMRLSENLTLLPVQTNLHPFYNWADIILNLSKPDSWVETFGLTIIEGMAHRLPSIVPPIGGIAELVEDGANGFWADSRDISMLSRKLQQLCHPIVYDDMKRKAAKRISNYRETQFLQRSLAIISNAPAGNLFHNVE